MKKITVSAPGKLMLLGEHSVVYGFPCIVTAVDIRLKLTIERTDEPKFILNAPDVDISDYQKDLLEVGTGKILDHAKCVEMAVKNFKIKNDFKSGIKISVASGFSNTYGFGSSSAVIVCTIFALAQIFNINLTKKEIFDIAYQTVLEKQGVGSGFDIASAIWGGTLYYVTPGKIIEPLQISNLPLIIGYTGVKSNTTDIVKNLKAKREQFSEKINRIFAAIGKLTDQGKEVLLKSDWESLGKFMNFDQEYLRNLGVSTEKLEAMILAAKNSGALGAKLSGAGGGDCMIALHPFDTVYSEQSRTAQGKLEIEQAITKVGGEVVNISTNAQGVRIENDI